MHVLVTGGAGYIGSALVGTLLAQQHRVTVVDDLRFGGDSLLAYRHHPEFTLIHAPAAELPSSAYARADGVVHLAALVGFPACSEAGRDKVWHVNVETTERVMESASKAGVERLVYASTYSNYGISPNGQPVTEESPLYPQSLYAESKIAAERYLLGAIAASECAPIILRFATLFGVSPRTRFDLIVNQFVLDAMTAGEIVIYGVDQQRAFIHIRDVCRAIVLMLDTPRDIVVGQIFNVGSEEFNCTKTQVADLVRKHVPEVKVRHIEARFDGDMRDIPVSFEKIRRALNFRPRVTVEEGILEVRDAILTRLIADPLAASRRNAAPLLPQA